MCHRITKRDQVRTLRQGLVAVCDVVFDRVDTKYATQNIIYFEHIWPLTDFDISLINQPFIEITRGFTPKEAFAQKNKC